MGQIVPHDYLRSLNKGQGQLTSKLESGQLMKHPCQVLLLLTRWIVLEKKLLNENKNMDYGQQNYTVLQYFNLNIRVLYWESMLTKYEKLHDTKNHKIYKT